MIEVRGLSVICETNGKHTSQTKGITAEIKTFAKSLGWCDAEYVLHCHILCGVLFVMRKLTVVALVYYGFCFI